MYYALLVVMLISSFTAQLTAQTVKRKKRTTKPKPVAIKKVEATDYAMEAIKTLRTLETVAEIGTTYSDYTKRLADVKIQVDELLTKIPADDLEGFAAPRRNIEEALNSYVNAAHYWDMKIKNRHRDLDASYSELINLAWQQGKSYLNLATKDLEKKK
jgi:hypothetical protein